MKTIILAGGRGTRLPISGKDKPKVLVDVAGKTILERQIEWLEKHNLSDIRLSLGYRAEQIIQHIENSPICRSARVDYVIEKEPLGTGGALKYASADLKEEFLALNGDVLCGADLALFVSDYTQKNVLRGTFLGSILARKCSNTADFGLLEIKNDKICDFLEKKAESGPGYINAGVYALSPEIFADFRPNEAFSIEKDVFPKLAAVGKLKAHIFEGFWNDLGTEERLEEVRKMFHVEHKLEFRI